MRNRHSRVIFSELSPNCGGDKGGIERIPQNSAAWRRFFRCVHVVRYSITLSVRILSLLLLCFLFFVPASIASAHPHAWITVRVVVVVNEKGEAIALKQRWLFDKMYSSYALDDFDPNKNGKVDDGELLQLAHENLSNLKEYGYFTILEDSDGKRLSFGVPGDVKSYFEGNATDAKQIVMEFTLPLETPLSLQGKGAAYRIYDPTYYIDMGHEKDHGLQLVAEKTGNVMKNCTGIIEHPKVAEEMVLSAAALDKNATAPQDLGYHFSEKAVLTCKQPK